MISNASFPSVPTTRPVRVLLVDDATRVRSELRRLLDLSGALMVVGEATDGLEAIRLTSEMDPDVVVMDLEMPVMDGIEATRRIKASSPAIRVVILSVHAGPAVEQRAYTAGADDFVIKGADYQILINAILGKDEPFNPFEKGEKS